MCPPFEQGYLASPETFLELERASCKKTMAIFIKFALCETSEKAFEVIDSLF